MAVIERSRLSRFNHPEQLLCQRQAALRKPDANRKPLSD
jgi:hypothetical protein